MSYKSKLASLNLRGRVGGPSPEHKPLDTLSQRERAGPAAQRWEGEGVLSSTACRQGVGVKPDRVKPLTLPPLRGGPLPLSLRERVQEKRLSGNTPDVPASGEAAP
jgi:hypothetical protein